MEPVKLKCPNCSSENIVLLEVTADQDQTKSMCTCRDCQKDFLLENRLVESLQSHSPVKRYLKG